MSIDVQTKIKLINLGVEVNDNEVTIDDDMLVDTPVRHHMDCLYYDAQCLFIQLYVRAWNRNKDLFAIHMYNPKLEYFKIETLISEKSLNNEKNLWAQACLLAGLNSASSLTFNSSKPFFIDDCNVDYHDKFQNINFYFDLLLTQATTS